MKKLTDVHQHLLWGIDDGPEEAKTTFALLKAAKEQNVGRIFATPHACPGFRPFDMGLYRARLDEARAYCRENALGIEICNGAEIAWTYHTVHALERGKVPTLGGKDCALIELRSDASWAQVYDAAEQLLHAGITPLFAHVERCRCFTLQPGEALRLKDRMDVFYQVNASTVLGGGGFFTKRFFKRMLKERAIDAVASDAHNCGSRPQRLGEAYDALIAQCGQQYADALLNFSEVTP